MAKVSKYGQWKYPGEDTIIPSGNITMKGVPYPVLGIDNLGNAKMMQPGGNYTFPGTAVYEIPMMAYGGDISVPSLKKIKIKSLPKAQTVGEFNPNYDVSKSLAENMELNRRAQVMGWNSVKDYEASGWGQNELALKQKALVNNPQVQQVAKTATEMNPELANVQARQDQLYSNNTSGAQKAVNQAYYTLSNPLDALGHYSKYGYVPQGNVGNYGYREDSDAFASTVNMYNPMAWLNAFYRLSQDIPKEESWTTLRGGANMMFDALEAAPLLKAARPIAEASLPIFQTLDEIGTASRGLSPNVSSGFFNKNYSPLFKFADTYGYVPDYSVGRIPANFEFSSPSIYRNINPGDLELAKRLNYVVSPYESKVGVDAALNEANAQYLKNYYFGRGATPQGTGGRLPGTAGNVDGYYPFFMEGTQLFDRGLSPRPLLRFNPAKAPNVNINESFLGAENYNFQPKTHTNYRIAVPNKSTRQLSNYETLYWDPKLNTYVPELKKEGGSLPKAQIGYLEDVTQEESDYWNQSYNKWRSKNLSYRDAYDAATADVNTQRGPSHPNYVYNSNGYLPNEDSGVIYTAQKPKPYEHLQDWPDFNESYQATNFHYNTDDAKRWEKDWYRERAKLPQFRGIAEKRFNLAEDINMQPWGESSWLKSEAPGAGGYYSPTYKSVNIPGHSFGRPLLYTHERSHWYDYNAPQFPNYNNYDPVLNSIIPSEYRVPGKENASDKVDNKESIYLPFTDKKTGYGLDYYYDPTEVRARINEWRRRLNIDPTKNYSNEELQKMIDEDINSGDDTNFDLYKIIRGRGDLLKRLHDAYVSNDTPNEDELAKAQAGGSTEEEILANRNRAFQDIIVDDEMFDEGDFELYLDQAQTIGSVKKGKTLFGRPYQVVETEAGPTISGYERPGETTRVKTVYYKNGNVAKQIIENDERGGTETTWHDKDGKVTAVENSMGYRTFSNGYFDYTNNPDYETSKRRQDESEFFDYRNKLDAFLKRTKLNLENMSKEGSQPGDSYNTVWPDWENDRFNYTRTKNPSIRKSNAKFQGGGLPDDYQDFLDYSETAPENRRPDSEWQYGNPRQYDHYGMWDALGKPKTFEEALANYPQWQPDPGDGYYHGFSTNPNTGVWLKSHIPGESHPGDTGWMEYKDFMLSNDRNWGAKNQNLVFDPEIQRMRYVERKQGGGSPILNMMQQYGYTPAPETPDVFDQMRTMGILPQPTPTLVEQYNQVMNAFDKPKPKPVRFKVPEDYYTRLMQQENGLNKGLKDGRYYQYTSEEGGNDTIGYGHKLTDDDVKAGRYSKGLTKDEAIGLMRNDVEEHLDRTLEQYEAKFGKGSFDKLHPDLKVLALDFVYNGLPINEYPNFFGAANQYSTTKDATVKKQAYEKMLKNYIRNVKKDGVLVPLGERNKYTRSVLDNLK